MYHGDKTRDCVLEKLGSQQCKRIGEVLSESVGSVSVSGETQNECLRCLSSKLQF